VGRSTAYPIERLKGKKDFVPQFSYALALQREGRVEDAAEVYNEILSSRRDPRVSLNLGNCYAEMHVFDKATEMYQQSLQGGTLSSAYYNLSMVSREQFKFPEADSYFLKAVEADYARVTQFRSLWNDIKVFSLMTETLTSQELLSYATKKGRDYYGYSAGNFFLFILYSIVLIALLVMKRDSPILAMRCPKCGTRYCLQCQKRTHWGGMCSECFKNMVSFETIPSERIGRILKTDHYQKKRNKILLMLSFSVPGLSLIVGNKILTGFSLCFSFVFFLSLALISWTFTANIVAAGHTWLTIVSAVMAVMIYSFSGIYTLGRLREGWL
jgi:hypothetical protein